MHCKCAKMFSSLRCHKLRVKHECEKGACLLPLLLLYVVVAVVSVVAVAYMHLLLIQIAQAATALGNLLKFLIYA